MSDTIKRLTEARALAWGTLVPAFDCAIVLAEEAGALAAYAHNAAQVGCDPVCPALVVKLANAFPGSVVVPDVPF